MAEDPADELVYRTVGGGTRWHWARRPDARDGVRSACAAMLLRLRTGTLAGQVPAAARCRGRLCRDRWAAAAAARAAGEATT